MRLVTPIISGCLFLVASAAMAEDTFTITASNGISFDQDTKYAKVKWATDDAWAFDAGFSLIFRIQGFRFNDGPIAETQELINNNTGFSFKTKINGESVAISCRGTEDDLVGWVKRTELTETRVSGSFEVQLVRCIDGNTTKPIEYEHLPIIVEGVFSVDRKGW